MLLYRAKHPEHHMLTHCLLLQAASDIEEEMAEMDSAADSDKEEGRASLKVEHKPTALFRVATTTKCIVQNAENVLLQSVMINVCCFLFSCVFVRLKPVMVHSSH